MLSPKPLGWVGGGRQGSGHMVYINRDIFHPQEKVNVNEFLFAVAAGIHMAHHNQWEFNSEKKEEEKSPHLQKSSFSLIICFECLAALKTAP